MSFTHINEEEYNIYYADQVAQIRRMPLGLRLVRRGQLAQCFAHARRALGLCAKTSPVKVSRTLHAAYSRTGLRDALEARRYSSLSNGLWTAQ